jgi:tetratricopeptide (TPR) repeat protein
LTSPSTLTAFISPRDRVAGVVAGSQVAISATPDSRRPAQDMPVSAYLARYPDTEVLDIPSPEVLADELSRRSARCHALDFTLMLFDSELSVSLRRDCAKHLSDLLAVESAWNYVLDVLLARPLPKAADIQGARQASEGAGKGAMIVEVIVECQERVRMACDAWLQLRDDELVRRAGPDRLFGMLIHRGALREMIVGAPTQAECKGVAGRIALRLHDVVDGKVLTKWINAYKKQLPVGISSSSASSQREASAAESRLHDRTAARSGRPPQVENQHQAETQVEKISDLFRVGKDDVANQFLRELIASQTGGGQDRQYVVKSLCNIATKCNAYGRRDCAIECLTKAVEFPEGTDAMLYLQMGNQFRNAEQYDEAIECYSKAEELDETKIDDRLRKSKLQMMVQQGRYEEAIQDYTRLPYLKEDPDALQGLGTVYRKIGDVRNAFDHYQQAVRAAGKKKMVCHAAHAGWAETNKQTGRYDKAIRRYLSIFKDHADLDAGSRRVYESSLAYLYRITGNLSEAMRRLEQLHASFPKDPGIQFQLAKCHWLDGNIAKASDLFNSAASRNLDDLLVRLYRTAISDPQGISNGSTHTGELGVVPEQRELARCNVAIQYLANNAFEEATAELEGISYVDRLNADLGIILNAHALVGMQKPFSFRSNNDFCRIKKRGHPVLKAAAEAILDHQLDEVIRLERRMLLIAT